MRDPALTSKPPRASRWMRHGAKPQPDAAPAPDPLARPFWAEHGPVALVAVVAAVARVVGLSRRVLIYDESLLFDPGWLQRGLSAYTRDVWNNTTYNPGWAIIVWVMHWLFGLSTFAARVPSLVAGVLAPVAVYAAARAMGLGRRAGLWAAAIMALSLFQVEYSQQILPYAILPLGAGLCLWLVTKLAGPEVQADPLKQAGYAAGFVATFGILVFIHNSTLLLVPPLFGFWAWSVFRPVGESSASARRLAAVTWGFCALAAGLAALGWFFAKAGEADRIYLHPYFPGTFLAASDRHFASEMINSADGWYARHRPDVQGSAGRAVDLAFFTGSRVFDFFFGHFRTTPETQVSRSWAPWLIPLPMLALLAYGALRGLRGESGPLARRWVVCFTLMLGLCLLLSGLRAFPLGGIRQLICLSPLVVLTAAAAFDGKTTRLGRVAVVAGLVWAAGAAYALPKYYRATRDVLTAQQLKALADQYGVRDIVAGDTLCSVGALRIHNALGPRCHVFTSDDLYYVELLKQHRPFLLVSLNDPLLAKTGDAIEPTGMYKFLAHPLATLNQYTATPLIRPRKRISWVDWTVYIVRPKPGPYPPEVVDVERYLGPRDVTPRSFAVRFSKPVRPGDLTEQTVRISPKDAAGGWSEPPVPATVHYLPETQTVFLTPRQPLPVRDCVLTLERSIRDLDGRPLDAAEKAFYHVIPSAQISRADASIVK